MIEPDHEHPEITGEIVAHVSCVRHTYGDSTVVSLCGLDFVVGRGQRAVILGRNGSGKTTLLFHLLGLLKPDEGMVQLLGKNPAREWSSLAQRVGVVLQNVEEQILAPTVFDDVAFGPRNFGLKEDVVRQKADQALERLAITHLPRQGAPRFERRREAQGGAGRRPGHGAGDAHHG